jgi:putative ABC transport system permease protein
MRLGADRWVTVIGVAKINNYIGLSTPAVDMVYLPYGLPYTLPSGAPKHDIILVVRSERDDPYAPVESIRTVIRDLDRDQAVPSAETWQSTVGSVTKLVTLGMNTMGAMGVLGLALALVGLYGLLAYEVSARTREIGIRMALGARPGAVVRMVLRQGILLAVCGVGAGVGLNFAAIEITEAMFGSGGNAPKPADPNAGAGLSLQVGTEQFGGGAFWTLMVAVFAVTLLAAYLPARRAARVDPNVALRSE